MGSYVVLYSIIMNDLFFCGMLNDPNGLEDHDTDRMSVKKKVDGAKCLHIICA